MGTRPFFSILLPTKNRAHLVGYAIRSVLGQSFEDFELIIADNDDTDATSNVVDKFKDDRIRYVRTGGLDMVQNWNAALNESNGEYVLLLEDKFIFYPQSFLRLYDFFSEKDPQVVVWHRDIIDDASGYYRKIEPFFEESKSCDDILQTFLLRRNDVWQRLPRGLCTALHRSVIAQAQRKFFGPFYDYISPDLVSALKVLRVAKKIHYFGVNINCVISYKVSNGMRVRTRKDNGSYFGGDALRQTELRVPVKNKYIVANLIAHDIEVTLRERLRDKEGCEPYYASYKRAYYSSLMAEIGLTFGEVGWRYEWGDIKEIILKSGMDPFPPVIFFYHALRQFAKKVLISKSGFLGIHRYDEYNSFIETLIVRGPH